MIEPADAVRYRVLGPLEIVDAAGRPVVVRSELQRRLLAALLLHANRRVSFDALAEFLWGDDLPDDVTGAVHSHVSRARRTLGLPELVTVPGGYALDVPAGSLDSERFQDLLDHGTAVRTADPRALASLERALDLWRGPAYGDFLDWDRARTEASRLDEMRLRAAEERFEVLVAMGRHAEAVPGLVRLAEEEPLRERPRTLLMTALYRSGRQPDALRVADDFRRRLGDEVGLEPSPALRQLEREILDHRVEAVPAAESPGRIDAVAPAGDHVWPPVPRPVSRLVGRQDVVTRAADLCRAHRLVTLTGPGGVGKTRLAYEVARQLAAEHDGRVAVCELAAVGRGGDVAAAVATTLGVEPKAGVTLESRLVEVLRTRPALLVVDNCEHVVTPAARLIEQLVEGTDGLRVLATSRERLAVRGEQLCPVEPLSEADALDLFTERARAVAPDFELTDDDRERATELCQRLDGLPLAIELAAARTAVLSVHDIAEGLGRRFALLTGGRRSEQRHRSLHDAVRWSYDLLDDDERRVFADLAVFAGGFTAEAAAAVSGLDLGEAVALVGALVERCLVRRERRGASSRFLLLETVREFGLQRLVEQGDEDRVRRAHAGYFVERAEDAERALRRPADADTALRGLDDELANLRAAHLFLLDAKEFDGALRLHAALFWYASFRLRPEVLAWAEATTAVAPERHPLLALALASCARLAWQSGDGAAWAAVCGRGLALSEPGDPTARTFLGEQGLRALHDGDLAASSRLSAEALALDIQVDDGLGATIHRAQVLLARGYAGEDGSVADAVAWVADAERGGHAFEITAAHYVAGELQLGLDPVRAREHLERAHELAERTGNRFYAGIAGASLASLEVRHGDADVAAARYRDLIEHWRRSAVSPVQSTMLRTVVELLARLGRPQPAAELLGVVTDSRSALLFGEDADRLARLGQVLRTELGETAFDAAVAAGRRRDDAAALDLAAAALA